MKMIMTVIVDGANDAMPMKETMNMITMLPMPK